MIKCGGKYFVVPLFLKKQKTLFYMHIKGVILWEKY